jgi:hypothetical protein
MDGFHTLTIWNAQLRFFGLWPMLDVSDRNQAAKSRRPAYLVYF